MSTSSVLSMETEHHHQHPQQEKLETSSYGFTQTGSQTMGHISVRDQGCHGDATATKQHLNKSDGLLDDFHSNRTSHDCQRTAPDDFSPVVVSCCKRPFIDEFSDPTESCSSDDDGSSCCSFYDDEEGDVDGEGAINCDAIPMVTEIKGNVVFQSVHIREYASTVGDHPLCVDSCPLTFGWEHLDLVEQDVESYESKRFFFRRNVPRRLDIDQRRDRIKETCDMDDQTLQDLEFQVALERLNSSSPKALSMRSNQDCEDDEDEEMQLEIKESKTECYDNSHRCLEPFFSLNTLDEQQCFLEPEDPELEVSPTAEAPLMTIFWERVVPNELPPQKPSPTASVWV